MNVYDNYECDGQITISDYLASKIENRTVMDLTEWINSQGKAQYGQVEDLIREAKVLKSEDAIDKLTNKVSVYILNMSLGYMKYLRKENE
ncbi:MAG: hypothetical protein IIY21_11120 [Clostridiales bacterium]|nr:hypothetical protein [Clostridiales bacterium]